MEAKSDRRPRIRRGDRGAGPITLVLVVAVAILGACRSAPRLPPDTVLDSRAHLLASSNFGDRSLAGLRLIVTGVPEGPNMVADSTGSSLDDFFAGQDRGVACAQVYCPANPLDLAAYRRFLQEALRKASVPVSLVVYSMGAFSIMNLPKEYWGNIRSLTFASPAAGREAVVPSGNLANRLAIRAVRGLLPSTKAYMESIGGLLERLMADGARVSVDLGDRDSIIDDAVIGAAFAPYDRTGTMIHLEERPHGLTAAQVTALFAAADGRD